MMPKGIAMYKELTTMRSEIKAYPPCVSGTTSPNPTVVIVESTSQPAMGMEATFSRGSTMNIRVVKTHAMTAIVYSSTGNASNIFRKAETRSCICGNRRTSLKSLITGTKTRRTSFTATSTPAPNLPCMSTIRSGSPDIPSMRLDGLQKKAPKLGQKMNRTMTSSNSTASITISILSCSVPGNRKSTKGKKATMMATTLNVVMPTLYQLAALLDSGSSKKLVTVFAHQDCFTFPSCMPLCAAANFSWKLCFPSSASFDPALLSAAD
mmetsp:Transcript_110221/g.235364  ORF Transcript_110221/g.235364 Transcript_110221/m.235364 type:complete len:266 (-) Transcript_110221:483-1280(-)